MNFYDEIKRLCRIKGFTIDSLLKAIGKSGISVFSGWKQRNVYPRADDFYKICEALEVSMEHFFTDETGIVVQQDMVVLVKKFNNLSQEEINILNCLNLEQIKKLIEFAKSMKLENAGIINSQ